MHGELAEHAVHASHGMRGLHGLRVLHALHVLRACAYSQVEALPGFERIKNPPRRSDIEAKVRPAESSLTAAIARSRHVAGPESNQEADSSQRDSRRDRSEAPGMPTDSRPEIRGIRPFRYGQPALFSSHERPYSASSYQATISRPAGTDCHFRDSLMPPRGGRSTDAHAASRNQNILHLIGLGRPRPARGHTMNRETCTESGFRHAARRGERPH